MVLKFHSAKGLRTCDGKPPSGFELRDSDGNWRPAKARIVDSAIELISGDVTKPSAVRYGWIPFPEPRLNLTNSNGLPAAPFSRNVQ